MRLNVGLITCAWAAVVAVSVPALWLSTRSGLSHEYFTRDPAATVEERVTLGYISTMGLLGWWTTVTALTIAAFGSWRDERERAVAFAVFSAVFAYLALDDLFQLHENVYLQLGFDQRLVQLLYAMGVLLVAAWSLRVLRETTPFTVLLVAGGCFVVSIVADARNFEGRLHAIEDGTKLLGIFTLAAWALACAIQRPSTQDAQRCAMR